MLSFDKIPYAILDYKFLVIGLSWGQMNVGPVKCKQNLVPGKNESSISKNCIPVVSSDSATEKQFLPVIL